MNINLNKMSSAEQEPNINKFASEIIRNPELFNDEEYKAKFLKEVEESKYNTIIRPKNDKVGLFTIIQPSDEYRKSFLMLAIFGYYHRVALEYKLEDKDAGDLYRRYIGNFVNNGKGKNKVKLTEKQLSDISKMASEIVSNFVREFAEYDPDKHVQKVYKEKLDDKERLKLREKYVANMKNEQARQKKKQSRPVTADANSALKKIIEFARKEGGATDDELKLVEDSYANNYEHEYKLISNYKSLLKMTDSLIDTTRTLDIYTQKADIKLPDGATYEFYHINLLKNKQILGRYIDILEAKTDLPREIKFMLNHDLAYDRFFHFQRYFEHFYEQLKDATTMLLPWREDIDTMVQFYDAFPAEASVDSEGNGAAEDNSKVTEFFNKYSSVVKFDVFSIETSNWRYIGPYSKNRSRCNFYNKNSAVLESILKNAEANNKIGSEIAKNQAKRAKKESIRKHGPDDADIREYSKYSKARYDIDTKEALSKEEKAKANEEYLKSQQLAEDGNEPGKSFRCGTCEDDNEPTKPATAEDDWRNTDDCPDECDQYNFYKVNEQGEVEFGKMYSDVLSKNKEGMQKEVDDYIKSSIDNKFPVAKGGEETQNEKIRKQMDKVIDEL